MTKTPLGRLVPGISTAAGLTSPTGRKSLQQHPVGALLDVLPFAGEATKLGVLGESARTAVEVGDVASQAEKLVSGGNLDLANELARAHGFNDYQDLLAKTPRSARVSQALASGRPFKATVRAVPQLDEARLSLLAHFNATPLATGYRRAATQAHSITSRKLEEYANKELKPLIAGVSEEDIARVGALAGRPDLWPDASPADQSILTLLQQHQDMKAADDLANTDLLYKTTIGGQVMIYGGEDATRLARLQRGLDKAVGKADKVEQDLAAARERGDQAAINKLTVRKSETAARLDAADRALQKTLVRTVPDRFKPLVEDQIRQKVMSQLNGTVGEDTPQFRDAMSAYDRGQPLASFIPDKTLAKYTAEARAHWQELVAHYNPIWIPSRSSESLDRALSVPRFRDKPSSPGVWKSRYINATAPSTNYILALGQAESERLHFRDNQQLIESYVRPVAKTTSEIDQLLAGEYEKLRKQMGATVSNPEVQNMVRTKAFTKVDESMGLGTQPTMHKLYKEEKWIPKDLAEAIKKQMAPPHPNELQKINLASIRLYKTTVMGLSPTHQAHIWLGSMLPLMLGAGREEFNPSRIVDAWKMVRGHTMPDLLNRNLSETDASELMDYAHGLKMGSLLTKVSNGLEYSRKLSEVGANFYRSWAYLSEEARGLRHNLSPEMASARGVAYANKVFVDIGGMTPVEQLVAKQIFPFYSYTRWALKFIMQYPVDHPLRASILANLGESEAAYNQAHGIPNTLSMLFSLGRPNHQGDQWGVQLRAFNPFRDTATAFTLAGIFRNLNPAAKAVLAPTGLNTISGTPDPYPGLDIDPNTGTLVGTAKGKSPLSAAEAVVPQLSLLDHYLGLSQQARSLRTADPQAFRRQVFSILNMPFVPQTYTPYIAQATRARDQLRVAQGEVSSALKSQNLGSLDIYDQVPVPSAIKAYLGGRTFVPTNEFKQAVEKIWEQERRTGIKVI